MLMMNRSGVDRRSVKDRRRTFCFDSLFYRSTENRRRTERRSKVERRIGWVRVTKWSSVVLGDLMIAKFLR